MGGEPCFPRPRSGEGSCGAAPTKLCSLPQLVSPEPCGGSSGPALPLGEVPNLCLWGGTVGAGDALTTGPCSPEAPSPPPGAGKLGCTPGLVLLTLARRP